MAKSTTAIITELYPLVASSLKKNLKEYKSCISRFMSARSEQFYKVAPMDRIIFSEDDANDLFNTLKIPSNKIKDILTRTYYWDIAAFNPVSAKDPFTILALMVVRYFYINNMSKELELSLIHLSFSGKFYPSVHYGSFPKVQPSEHEHIMLYVVNNELSAKYDIKSKGSVIGAVRSISETWIKSYGSIMKSSSDEDVVYLIQQLHTRLKSFIKNIATEYYRVYADKDSYMTYDSDNLSDDGYHLADSDSLKAERIVEKTIETINITGVDYKVCKMASGDLIKTDEIKSIIESIVTNRDNQPEVRELIGLLVTSYLTQSKTKDIRDIDFITFSITPKPNSKNKDIIRQKEIIEGWLDDNSPGYRKRRSRLATKNSYIKAIYTYFTIIIHNANK